MTDRTPVRRRARTGARRQPAPQPQEAALAVGYLMGRARASLLSALDLELSPFALSSMQFAVLKHLADGAAQTAADLCRLMHYDTGSMTRILDRLEERDLVRRERSRADRRVVALRLGAAGRARLPRLRAVAAGVLAGHLAGFSAAEVEALKTYLVRMIDNGRSAGDNPGPGTGP